MNVSSLLSQNNNKISYEYTTEDLDIAEGLSRVPPIIYKKDNQLNIGYSTIIANKRYGAQLKIGHWLESPEYRINQGDSWTDG